MKNFFRRLLREDVTLTERYVIDLILHGLGLVLLVYGGLFVIPKELVNESTAEAIQMMNDIMSNEDTAKVYAATLVILVSFIFVLIKVWHIARDTGRFVQDKWEERKERKADKLLTSEGGGI